MHNPLMPKGVEHLRDDVVLLEESLMHNPLMPKGVEHCCCLIGASQPSYAQPSDAERR